MSNGVVEAPTVMTAEAPRSRRRLWISLAAVLVLLAAGSITAVSVAFRYVHAAALECACGLSWGDEHSRSVQAGPYAAMIAPARPGHLQSFYVLIINRASVTQTILGLQDPGSDSLEPEELAVARPSSSPVDDEGDYLSRAYSGKAMAIPPHDARWLRLSIHTAAGTYWRRNRQEYWTDLYLRVRVGWFDRNETVPLGTAMVLHG